MDIGAAPLPPFGAVAVRLGARAAPAAVVEPVAASGTAPV
jgi:hypothetical protein